jgi:hypothetical protein
LDAEVSSFPQKSHLSPLRCFIAYQMSLLSGMHQGVQHRCVQQLHSAVCPVAAPSRRRLDVKSFYRRYATVTPRPTVSSNRQQTSTSQPRPWLCRHTPWMSAHSTYRHSYGCRCHLSSQSSSARTAMRAWQRAKVCCTLQQPARQPQLRSGVQSHAKGLKSI